MASDSRPSRKLLVGLALAILFDTGLQIFWKMAVSALPDQPTLLLTLEGIIHQPLFLLVGLFMVGQCFNWLAVLNHADLSYAHAITSLSYVSVAVLSVMVLGEIIEWQQLAGIMLILSGVWFVTKSDHSSAPVKSEAS
jgi:drug/metabolite transporter (DMT)-like permease